MQQSDAITRRALLSRTAMAVPVAALAAAGGTALAMDGHPDAALLGLYRELEVLWDAESQLAEGEPDERFEAAVGACSRIVEQILVAPASTLDGLRVKAQAFLWCGHEAHEIALDCLGYSTDRHLAASILRDLAGMGAPTRASSHMLGRT